MNVLLLVLGGFPARHLSERVTPVLWDLATNGGWVPDGGEAVMTSACYPNCATFATGATPNRHRLLANRLPTGEPGVGSVGAWELGPALPTLFDACRDAGRTSAAVVADPRLLGVLGAVAADIRWPTIEVDTSDTDIADTLVTLLADPPDLTVAHLSGPSQAAHVFGPDSPAARERYHETDVLVASVVATLRRRWTDFVLMVVSDHDVEPSTSVDPIDLDVAVHRYGLRLAVVPEGGAALVLGTDNQQGRWLADAHGVAGTLELTPDLRLVWARPGRVFGPSDTVAPLGIHGGPGTTAQVAVVAGGHPSVAAIAGVLARRTPRASDWAVTIAELLDLDLPTATGRSLLAPVPARAAS